MVSSAAAYVEVEDAVAWYSDIDAAGCEVWYVVAADSVV